MTRQWHACSLNGLDHVTLRFSFSFPIIFVHEHVASLGLRCVFSGLVPRFSSPRLWFKMWHEPSFFLNFHMLFLFLVLEIHNNYFNYVSLINNAIFIENKPKVESKIIILDLQFIFVYSSITLGNSIYLNPKDITPFKIMIILSKLVHFSWFGLLLYLLNLFAT